MQTPNAGRCLLVSALVLSLAACTTQSRIGDTGQALMPPGSGLVAATVFLSNPVQPTVMKLHGFSHGFWFTPTDGQKGEWALDSPRDAVYLSKDPRALPDDGAAKLILSPVKPGKYRMTRVQVSHDLTDFNLRPKQSKAFEVVAGEVTYIGSISLSYASRYEGKYSQLAPSYVQMVIKNDFERDVRELKSLDKRLESVVFRNAAAK